MMIYSGYDDELVALKGARAVSQLALGKDLFVERSPRKIVQPLG
jgi:hypothetical protein